MNNFVNLEKDLCYGCRACSNVCPVNAITFKNDDYGFSYPSVSEDICINCGKCSSTCKKINEIIPSLPRKAFAATNRDEKILKKSASGGVFSALADFVLKEGGAVCGCIYDKDLYPIHICTENFDDAVLMRKSKYAQSNIGLVYREINRKLKNGQTVLFTGTPCQVAALYSTLDKNYSNLITMDLVCHGVPSEMMFQGFIKYLEKKYKTKIKSFDFRSKKYGWQRYTMEFTSENGRKKNIGKFNEFYHKAFISGNIMRPNCFSCKFADKNRISDITVGDFWGHEKLTLECDIKNGVSLCTLNSEKALSLLSILENKLFLEEIDYQIAVDGNTCLRNPTVKGNQWNRYMEALKNDDIETIAKNYIHKNRKFILKEKIKLLIPLGLFHRLKNKRRLKKTK